MPYRIGGGPELDATPELEVPTFELAGAPEEATEPEEVPIMDDAMLIELLITLAELLPVALELLVIVPDELLLAFVAELLRLPELPDVTPLELDDAETDDVATDVALDVPFRALELITVPDEPVLVLDALEAPPSGVPPELELELPLPPSFPPSLPVQAPSASTHISA